jgi:hypothetical protein
MSEAPERVLYQPGFVDAWRTNLPPERARIPAVEYIRADKVQAMVEAAYLAGFNASGEGYNGEYPFDQRGINPASDAGWVANRNDDLAALDAKP